MDNLTHYVIEKIYSYCSGQKEKHTDRLNFRCPVCGDSKTDKSKKRGWFYFATNSFYCYNCQNSCNAYNLLSILENKEIKEIKRDLIKDKILLLEPSNSNSFTTEPSNNNEFTKVVKEYTTKEDSWIHYSENKLCSELVKTRRLMEAPFKPNNWDLYYCTYFKRLVIPWLDESNQISYYQLRSLLPAQQPKYLFPKNGEKNLFITNLDTNFPYIFLVEGVLDAIFCKNSACIGSSSLTVNQKKSIELYKSLGYKIVWLLDNQRVDESSYKKTLSILKPNHNAVFKDIDNELVFIWDKKIKEKDINEYYIKNKTNPFKDEQYLLDHTFYGAKALLKLKVG